MWLKDFYYNLGILLFVVVECYNKTTIIIITINVNFTEVGVVTACIKGLVNDFVERGNFRVADNVTWGFDNKFCKNW